MEASVEARVPFVGHRLVELAFSIPSHYKLRWKQGGLDTPRLLLSDEIFKVSDTPKYLLKRAFEDQSSHDVLYRRKMGFPVPLNDWFGGRFRGYARDMLLGGRSTERGMYNTPELTPVPLHA